MLILALDSTAQVGSVALSQDETLIAEYTINTGNTHSETLLPMVESVLKIAGYTVDDVELFVCTAGPGSFTGVRIGASTIKGMAFGKGKPCVGVSTLEALALVKDEYRAERVVGLEVWRSLDWLPDSEKLLMDTSAYPELAKALLDVYESQIAGGKSYDLAAIGRRYANATFFESHSTDGSASLSYGLDMTALAYSDKSPEDFICSYIDSFKYDVVTAIRKLKK
jgi:tRNA threonylcarbamoyl adenosine modification protein YeaZ